jgi:hypothetical protein
MRILWCVLLFAGIAFPRTGFWAPLAPPLAHYSADVKYDAASARLEGTETIRFRNDTARPIGVINIRWFGDALTVAVAGVRITPPEVSVYPLPEDVAPGQEVTLALTFGASWKLDPKTDSAITSFVTPRLSWGFGTLDNYEVRLSAPDGYVWGASGRWDAARRAYVAERARTFGAFLGKGYQTAEADTGGVQVRAVFTPKGRPCAELLLKTAVDAIGFYRERFGFYPHRSITIAPGMDYPAGGYPPATALVVVHGQQRMSERPEAFWRWITAHEVGHMYWGDHVLAQGSDSLNWLMIGMGIRADQAYRRARGITGAGNLEANLGSGLMQGRDTTMDVTKSQAAAIGWDFNNIVEHGKSIAMLNALESVVGADAFESLYRRCLREYGGKQLGWREFQRVAEIESGEDLNWFFEAWVRSPGNVFYRTASKECALNSGALDCTIKIEQKGDVAMPVTVEARFAGVPPQRARTDRLLRTNDLHFRATAPLSEVVVDPDRALILVDAPAVVRTLLAKVRELPFGADGAAAADIYGKEWRKIDDPGMRFRLGLLLYDGRKYTEALEVMRSIETELPFQAHVWEGHLLDLTGRRTEALAAYQVALQDSPERPIRHDQWKMSIDKAWVEERLKTPFERK